ncbi:MAG TPA: hypothetical protein VEY07_06180 [Thermoplasmata archaeon]|nr:hypothetical protein [Thermoplasmata archaeon]
MYYEFLDLFGVPRMRAGIVVVGIVLAIIGAVLLFVPVSSQAAQKIDESGAAVQVGGFSITGSIPVAVSWTSTEPVTFYAAACSGSCATGSIASLSGVTIQVGTSGTFTINQPSGGQIAFGFIPQNVSSTSATATVNMTTALTTVGSIVLIVGILILIVGLVLRSKSKASAMPPPQPATPGSDPNQP